MEADLPKTPPLGNPSIRGWTKLLRVVKEKQRGHSTFPSFGRPLGLNEDSIPSQQFPEQRCIDGVSIEFQVCARSVLQMRTIQTMGHDAVNSIVATVRVGGFIMMPKGVSGGTRRARRLQRSIPGFARSSMETGLRVIYELSKGRRIGATLLWPRTMVS